MRVALAQMPVVSDVSEKRKNAATCRPVCR